MTTATATPTRPARPRARRRDDRRELGRLRAFIRVVAIMDRERGDALEERVEDLEARVDALTASR